MISMVFLVWRLKLSAFIVCRAGVAMPKGSSVVDIEFLNAGYRYALSLASDHQDAEDLVHDAWIRLDRRYGKCSDKPLLFRTIRNLYIDQYRRRQKIQFSEFDENHFDQLNHENSHRSIENSLMNADEMQMVLERLRDVEREALYLSVVEGYTADEVAQMMESTRGTVLSLVHRSKAKLRQWLTPDKSPVEKEEDKNTVVELNPGGRRK